MKKNNIEVEIKSLLGSYKAKESLISRMYDNYNNLTLIRKNKQLNHYFTSGNLQKLENNIVRFLNEKEKDLLQNIIQFSMSHSVRTRKADNNVLFVVKATLDETTSSNGIARSEFEVEVPLSIDDLDQLILDSGFKYQAKWSRERHEYLYKEYTVSIDKNAGYGYLAEFERVVPHDSDFVAIKKEIRGEFELLGIQELQQDRLERMFAHYNKNWKEYYGTDKTFVIL